ncbi:abnormal spindle-like microcephaly-associated protein homolog [Centruroides vittatus]|uniref:abnormal spindle-like microcephaly-associated protein homolog n=1 Tax=Centruroides vittatus TaxID=120091 RepID=UPI00350FAEBB
MELDNAAKFEVMTFSPPAPLPKEEEVIETPIILLTYFGTAIHICFDKVKIGATKIRQAVIKNPNDTSLEVMVKRFPYSKGFSINVQKFILEKDKETYLDITWAPTEEGCFREIVLLQANNGCQKQIILLGTAITPKKKKKQVNARKLSVNYKIQHYKLLNTEIKEVKTNKRDQTTVGDKISNGKGLFLNSENCENDSNGINVDDFPAKTFARQDAEHPLPPTPLRRQTYILGNSSPEKNSEVNINEDKTDVTEKMSSKIFSNTHTTHRKKYHKRTGLKQKYKLSPLQRNFYTQTTSKTPESRRETFTKQSLSQLEDSLEFESNELLDDSFNMLTKSNTKRNIEEYNNCVPNNLMDKFMLNEQNAKVDFFTNKNFVEDIYKEGMNVISEVDVDNANNLYIQDKMLCNQEKIEPESPEQNSQENDFYDSINESSEKENSLSKKLQTENASAKLPSRLSSDTVVLTEPSVSPEILPHYSSEKRFRTETLSEEKICPRVQTKEKEFIPSLFISYNPTLADSTCDFSFLSGKSTENKYCSTGITSKLPPLTIMSDQLSCGNRLSFHEFNNFHFSNISIEDQLNFKIENTNNRKEHSDVAEKLEEETYNECIQDEHQKEIIDFNNQEKDKCSVFTISPPVLSKSKYSKQNSIVGHTNKLSNTGSIKYPSLKANLKTKNGQKKDDNNSESKPKMPPRKKFKIAQSKLTLIKPVQIGSSSIRHPNPFAAKNMYYDEKWMLKQEFGFTRWINYILTPPEDLTTDDVIKVDAGKLWQENMYNAAANPAPTKEQLSFKAYTAMRQLNRLRHSACLMYQSQPMVFVITRLETEIENNKLVVRKDKALHADIGIRKYILKLLLDYNPLWLRIGLETVFGELIHLNSNNDILGLSRFIIQRLLNNPDISSKYAHPKVPHLYKPGYEDELKKFTLKKFLLLVYFLDNAKLTRLIDHDPCLFCKNAKYKSSRDLLLSFSREFLSGEGDITRHLRYLGYSVSHTQTALEEFEYAVTNLAVDLRCGLRLARVIELILKQWSLSKKLRVPAISRLQKIHNVEVSLEALKASGFILLGNIGARDIVDGHREKTLSLLWQIIFKTQVEVILNKEKLKEEIVFLRKNFRVCHKLASIKDYSSITSFDDNTHKSVRDNKLYAESEVLQLLLQWCQTVCLYYNLMIENFTVSFCDGRALCYLIHHYHPCLLKSEEIKSNTTQTFWAEEKTELDESFEIASRTYENNRSKNEYIEELLNNERCNIKLAFDKIQELGGIPITTQPSYVSNTIPDEKIMITLVAYLNSRLMDLSQEIRAARIIQLAWRRRKLQKQIKQRELERKAAIIIQNCVKKFLAKQKMEKQRRSALIIQKTWRGYKARQLRNNLRLEMIKQHQEKMATLIQKTFRGYLARKTLDRKKNATILLQAHVRRYLAQKKYKRIYKAILSLQNYFRSSKLAKLERKKYLHLKQSVILIQSHFKRIIEQKRYRVLYRSAVILQSYTRMWIAKTNYLKTKSAIITIQQRYRAILKGRLIREEYLSLRNAAIKIQNWFRGIRIRRGYLKKKQAAVIIQKYARQYTAQKTFKKTKIVVMNVQRRWRATLLMRKEREKCLIYKNKIILVQSYVRKWVCQQQWKKIRKSAIIIQAAFKGLKARKQYNETKWATMIIQKRWRAYQFGKKERENYIKIYRATILIQSLFRCYTARKEFVRQKMAAVTIQAFVRMFLTKKRYLSLKYSVNVIEKIRIAQILSRKQREAFIKMKKSAIMVQSVYRGYYQRKVYLRKRQAAVILQSSIRSWLVRCSFKKLHAAAISIQKFYKSVLLMRCQREEFLKLKKYSIFIQSRWKSKKMQKDYIEKKSAAVTIQRQYRAKLTGKKVREDYLRKKSAVLTIQSACRGFLCRKQFRQLKAIIMIQSHVRRYLIQKNYKILLRATVKIQSLVRMYQQRSRYLKVRNAAITLQRHFRIRREALQVRNQFLLLRASSVKLQACIRMRIQRKQYIAQKTSCIKIQSLWRGYSCRKLIRRMNMSAVVIQTYYRAYLKGKEERNKYMQVKNSTITLQSWFRMVLVHQQYVKQKSACILIQSYFRAYIQRKELCKMKKSAVIIQQHFRAYYYGKKVRDNYKKTRLSVIKIQSTVRRFIARKKFLQHQEAVIKIQAWYKGKKAVREYRRIYSAVLTIQKYFKRFLFEKQLHLEYLQRKKAVGIIERAYKSYKERKLRYLMAVIKIQSLVRMHLVRNNYLTTKKACLRLQAIYCMKREKKKYLQTRNAVITLQRYFKATIKRNFHMKQYLIMKKACVVIQAWWRQCLVRKHQQRRENAAKVIQRKFRTLKTRREFLNLRKASIIVQKRWKAILLQRTLKAEFIKQWKAAIIIQRFYIKYKIVKEIKTLYSTCVLRPTVSFFLLEIHYLRAKAAMKIQSWYKMILCKRLFDCMKRPPLKSFAKLYMQTSDLQSKILFYKNLNAVIIQSWYRRYYQKKCYLDARKKIIKIQSCYRSFRERRRYLRIRSAAILIQRRWRSYKAEQQKIKKTEEAVLRIQAWYRRIKMKRLQEKRERELLMEILKKCSLTNINITQVKENCLSNLLQSSYNCYTDLKDIRLPEAERHVALHRFICFVRVHIYAIRIQRCYKHYKCKKLMEIKINAVIVIQRYFKAKLARIRYLKLRKTIIVFQKAARNYLGVRHRAAITIQAVTRSWLTRMHLNKLYRSATTIQAAWRGYKQRCLITNKKIIEARSRVKSATAAATEDMKLVNRTNYALYLLLGKRSLTHILSTLINLDKTSQLSPICCEKMTEGKALDVLMHILRNCNRSVPHMELIKYTINIFLNLAKYSKTVDAVWNTEGMLDTILELMKIYREKGAGIFSKLCTLIWILCQDPNRVKVIKENKQTVDKIASFHYLIMRKQMLNKSQQKSKGSAASLCSSTVHHSNGSQALPRTLPDWTCNKNQTREFDDPLTAITAIMKVIGIKKKEGKQWGNTSLQTL